jgi:hypothetical protein
MLDDLKDTQQEHRQTLTYGIGYAHGLRQIGKTNIRRPVRTWWRLASRRE